MLKSDVLKVVYMILAFVQSKMLLHLKPNSNFEYLKTDKQQQQLPPHKNEDDDKKVEVGKNLKDGTPHVQEGKSKRIESPSALNMSDEVKRQIISLKNNAKEMRMHLDEIKRQQVYSELAES